MFLLIAHFLFYQYFHKLSRTKSLLHFFFGFDLSSHFSVSMFGLSSCKNLLSHRSLINFDWCYNLCSHTCYCNSNPYLEGRFNCSLWCRMKHLSLKKFDLLKGHSLELLSLNSFTHCLTSSKFLFSLRFAMLCNEYRQKSSNTVQRNYSISPHLECNSCLWCWQYCTNFLSIFVLLHKDPIS